MEKNDLFIISTDPIAIKSTKLEQLLKTLMLSASDLKTNRGFIAFASSLKRLNLVAALKRPAAAPA